MIFQIARKTATVEISGSEYLEFTFQKIIGKVNSKKVFFLPLGVTFGSC